MAVEMLPDGRDHDLYGLFEYGTPPEKNGDYAFLLHMLKSLKRTGKAAIILPHDVLFRGGRGVMTRATDQSSLAPARRTFSAATSRSFLRNCVNSSGVSPTGS